MHDPTYKPRAHDAVILFMAASVLKARAKKPLTLAARVIIKLLDDTAEKILDESGEVKDGRVGGNL